MMTAEQIINALVLRRAELDDYLQRQTTTVLCLEENLRNARSELNGAKGARQEVEELLEKIEPTGGK